MGGSLIDHPRPSFTSDAAAALLRTHFGIDGTLAPLDSERDQNFHVEAGATAFTLKIVNAAEPPAAMAFQTALLRHVAASAPELPLPRVVPALDGADVATAIGPAGEAHALRVVTYLAGTPMARVAATPALVHQLGRTLGRLDVALQSFGHPGAFRAFDWHVAETPRARLRVAAVRDDGRRTLIGGVLDRFDARVAPALPHLRHSVIHNDANDWNVLVDEAGRAVSGLIDVGDAVFAPTVADLAVAAAYAMLGAGDPVVAAEAIVRGFHEALPLTGVEQALLPDLIAARLAISVSISAKRQATSDDPYLFVSEAPA